MKGRALKKFNKSNGSKTAGRLRIREGLPRPIKRRAQEHNGLFLFRILLLFAILWYYEFCNAFLNLGSAEWSRLHRERETPNRPQK